MLTIIKVFIKLFDEDFYNSQFLDYLSVSYDYAATLFHFSFVSKNVFYSKNIQYAYNFYGTDLHVNVCRGVFRTQYNIYGGAYQQKSQESFIVDVRLGSKYGSGIAFTVEKVYRMSIFI